MSDGIPDPNVVPPTDHTVEEVLCLRVIRGMEDYRETGESVHLQDAHRALGTWLHFVNLTNADFDAGRR